MLKQVTLTYNDLILTYSKSYDSVDFLVSTHDIFPICGTSGSEFEPHAALPPKQLDATCMKHTLFEQALNKRADHINRPRRPTNPPPPSSRVP